MKGKLVSIIIPVHNCARVVENAVSSALFQTYENIEILLINNGSTDNSFSACEKLAEKSDKIRLFDTGDSFGAGLARNVGIDNAKGEYLYFLDADDECEPQTIERLVSEIEKTNTDVVICGHKTFAEGTDFVEHHPCKAEFFADEKDFRCFVASNLPHGLIGFLWNKLYKAEIIRNSNIRFKELSRLEDGFFNINYFEQSSSCVVIEDELYKYRLSTSEEVVKKHDKSYFGLYVSLVNEVISLREKWNLSDAPSKIMYGLCIDEFGTCVENAFLDGWGMTRGERKEFFKMMKNESVYKDMQAYLSGANKYRKLLILLLNKNLYFLLEVVVRLKHFVKTKFRRAYYGIKN